MKLISWNCQGAFRKKAKFICSLQPDILVVQECEHPNKLNVDSIIAKPNNFYWHSSDGKKGIAIFFAADYQFELLADFNPAFRYVIPLKVTCARQTLTVFSIWAMDNKEDGAASYIGQVWLALNYYKHLLGRATVLIGDFNSNKIWDSKPRVGTHTDVVNMLAAKNIYSAYHTCYGMEQGEEKDATFYMYRKKDKPYHIDYGFFSVNFLDKIKSIEIGSYHDWIMHSDHMPLIIELA